MALFLREDDVKQVLTMPLALERVAAAFRYLGTGEAIDLPRERVRLAPRFAATDARARCPR
jgi:ornithine cyclodeaminase